jgi:hypothetical protein
MREVDEKLLGVSQIPEGYYVILEWFEYGMMNSRRFEAGQGWKKDRLCKDLEQSSIKYSQRIHLVE